MRNYLDLIQNILDNGIDETNERTGEVCRTIVGPSIQFDCREGFHAVTTKKLAFRSVVAELLGFLNGATDAAQFRALNTKIWDDNANKTPGWLKNEFREGEDHLGPIYGKQWVDWETIKIAYTDQQTAAYSARPEWVYIGSTDHEHPEGSGLPIFRKTTNQVTNLIKKLLTDPTDRRMIVSAWNVGEFEMMALPPCHIDYRFVSTKPTDEGSKRNLHVVMTMRSTDVYLGLPFNIASTELFLRLIARLTNHEAATVTIQMTNAHLYHSHIEKARIQAKKTPQPLARLKIAKRITAATILPDGTLDFSMSSLIPEDFELVDYSYHIWDSAAPMAV